MAVLRLGPGSASELAKVINEPTRTVSYHLRKLEEEGMISVDEVKERRGGARETFYRIGIGPVIGKDEWDEMTPLERERVGNSISLTILGDISRALSSGFPARADTSQVWHSFPVDVEGATELQQLVTKTTAEVLGICERNRERLQQSGEPGTKRSVVMTTHQTPPR